MRSGKRRHYDLAGHAGVSERWSTEDIFRGFEFGDFMGGRSGDFGDIFGDFFGARRHITLPSEQTKAALAIRTSARKSIANCQL